MKVKNQKFFNLYEKLHGSEWVKRYKKWLTGTLIFDEDADEGFQEEFVAAEVDRLVGLVVETGEVGDYAVTCLEEWKVEDMNKVDGIIWLLESIVLDGDIKEEGRLVLRWEDKV